MPHHDATRQLLPRTGCKRLDRKAKSLSKGCSVHIDRPQCA
ncbi:hypothetical protein MGWOODY_Smn2697 [hydrothermal vent metagenome]|uniref:Uncharacterized protein n=1 Tax=hydrothermal vent metagenome TaxID=652676 RepID=A0A160TI40_9ZZZZ